MNISSEKTDLKNTYLAIVTMLLAILCVDMYMVVIKFLGDEYSVIQLAVFRNIAGVIPLFVLILFTKEYFSIFKNLNNKFIILSFLRGLAFLSMNIFIFISVINLEFATAMVLTFSSPFFIVILSIIFLNDKVGIYRWSAIFIGFFGVVLIVQPGSDIFSFYSIFPILTAIAWAFTVIILKFIPDGHSTAKIQLYTLIFNVIGGVILFLTTTGHTDIKSTQDSFTMVSLARHLGINSEQSLRLATQKFESRISQVIRLAESQGIDLTIATDNEKNGLWDQAKSV